MKKYKFTAETIGFLEETIKANSYSEAWEIAQQHLIDGKVPENGFGEIDNEHLEEIKEK